MNEWILIYLLSFHSWYLLYLLKFKFFHFCPVGVFSSGSSFDVILVIFNSRPPNPQVLMWKATLGSFSAFPVPNLDQPFLLKNPCFFSWETLFLITVKQSSLRGAAATGVGHCFKPLSHFSGNIEDTHSHTCVCIHTQIHTHTYNL